MRLLHSLAERLLGAGVDEDIERRVRRRELGAAEPPEPSDLHPAQLAEDSRERRPIAHDRHRHARQAAQRGQALHLLLRGDPPDIAHDRLTVRRQPLAQFDGRAGGAIVRVVALQVDPEAPAPQPLHSRRPQVVLGGGGGREGHIGALVDPADVLPGDGRCHPEAVAPRETGDIRLIDRDRRHPQPVGRRDRLGAQEERRRRVQDIGREPGQDALHLRARQPHRKLPVSDRGHLVDAEAGVFRRRARVRADHDRLVPARGQFVEHPQDARRDPVHRGEETLADDGHAHAASVRRAGFLPVNGRCPGPLGILSP